MDCCETVLFVPWLTSSAGQSCLQYCKIVGCGNFTTDCENGFLMDYMSCIDQATNTYNCHLVDTDIGQEIKTAYPDECFYTSYSISELKDAIDGSYHS